MIGPAFPKTPRPWLRGPWAERSGDQIAMSLPLHSDANGHSGHGLADTAHTALYRNGELVAESDNRQPGLLEADLPSAPADYRLDVTADRGKEYAFTTKLEASWRFRSGTEPAEGTPLPLAAVRFAPDVDARNLAERKPALVPVAVQEQQGSQLGKAKRLRVWASYDDGASWTRAPLRSSPDGGKLARITPPADAEHVSLRASVRFVTGERVSQTMIRSYGLK